MKETLAFQITSVYRDFLSYTTKELKKLGLNFGQIPVIIYTGKHPGCSQSDLTKDLKMDWGYSQRSVSKLVETGFITKTFDDKSSCNCLNLTEKGREAFDKSHDVFAAWDAEKIEDFSPEEKETIFRLLRKITTPKGKTI